MVVPLFDSLHFKMGNQNSLLVLFFFSIETHFSAHLWLDKDDISTQIHQQIEHSADNSEFYTMNQYGRLSTPFNCSVDIRFDCSNQSTKEYESERHLKSRSHSIQNTKFAIDDI